MTLIKATHAGRLTTRSFHDLGDFQREAEKIVTAARDEAAQIIAQARTEGQKLVQEAAPQGFAEGKEHGLAEGRKEGSALAREQVTAEFTQQMDALVEAWSKGLQEFESQRADLLRAAREDILELALAMGARITRRVIEADPTVAQDHVAAALSLVTEPTAVTVSINPQDRPQLESVLGRLVEQMGGSAHVVLRDDPSVGRGGCLVGSGKGRIDATIESQIERVTAALLSREPKQRTTGSARADDAVDAVDAATKPAAKKKSSRTRKR